MCIWTLSSDTLKKSKHFRVCKLNQFICCASNKAISATIPISNDISIKLGCNHVGVLEDAPCSFPENHCGTFRARESPAARSLVCSLANLLVFREVLPLKHILPWQMNVLSDSHLCILGGQGSVLKVPSLKKKFFKSDH